MNRVIVLLGATSALALAVPATAQDHSNMPGMTMPAKPSAKKPVAKKAPPAKRASVAKKPASAKKPALAQQPVSKPAADGMEGMNHSAMPGMAAPASTGQQTTDHNTMDHSQMQGMQTDGGTPSAGPKQTMPGMDMPTGPTEHAMDTMPGVQMTGTALPAGNAPAPAPPADHYADRQYPPAEMERARREMMFEQGGQPFYQVMFNLAEYQAREGRDGYRWDGEAFFGGDINRLWLKTEGEGAFGEGVESAEIQALYSRAVGPYFNLQAGIRQDFKPSPTRTYATIGFEGLAPYWFEVEGALFLSTKGDVLGRFEGYYDQRITQRIVLQPRVEFNLAAQDVPENRLGSGLTNAELGLRLRYEITRQFAPYVGISYDAKAGRTADFARADGEDPTVTSLVAGVRFWF